MKLLLRNFVGCMFVLCTHDVMKQKSIVLKFQTGELYVALANIEDWCMVTVTAVINLPVNIVNKIQTGLQENFLYNYWHVSVGDGAKSYHLERPGWNVLGCAWWGGHYDPLRCFRGEPKTSKIKKYNKWDSIEIIFYNYWHILVGDRTTNYHPEMPDWRGLGCTCWGGHLSHFGGRENISGYKIGKIRKKYKWDSIDIFSTIIDIY